MKRRDFVKGLAGAALLPAIPGCIQAQKADEGWDFDRVLDRSGTWSIKYGRTKEGEIPMWIAGAFPPPRRSWPITSAPKPASSSVTATLTVPVAPDSSG